MSLTLGQVILAARDLHPAFEFKRVPDPVIASFLSDYQRELLSLAQERYPGQLASQVSIVFQAGPASVIGSIGAGTTSSGLPVSNNPDGSFQTLELPTGNAVTVPNFGAILSNGTTASSTANTLTPQNQVAWANNQFAGTAYVVITDGTGVNQIRLIQSNTTTTLTTSENWTVNPDSTSLWQIISTNPQADNSFSAVIGLPTVASRQGYLTNIDSNGNIYVDLSKGLTGTFDVGFPLPPYKQLLGGTVYFQGNDISVNSSPPTVIDVCTMPLRIVDYTQRQRAWGPYAMYQFNNQLFPIGGYQDWQQVQSVDLRYVPIPTDLVNKTDRFVLRDDARGVLAAKAASMMATRLIGAQDCVPPDPDRMAASADRAEQIWLQSLGSQHRVQTSYTREVW